MTIHDLMGQRQTNTRSMIALGREIWFEDRRHVLRSDAMAIVGDKNMRVIVPRLEPKPDSSSAGNGIDGVRKKIRDDLKHAPELNVGNHLLREICHQLDLFSGKARVMYPKGCFCHFHQVSRLCRKSRLRITKSLPGDVPEMGHLFFGHVQVRSYFLWILSILPGKECQMAQSLKRVS
jgi:hypothetical protein